MPKIVLYPNKVLRKTAKAVEKIDDTVLREVSDLVKVLEKSGDGAGLAAPQIGVSKRFLAIFDRRNKKTRVYINPKIVKFFGIKDFVKMIIGEKDDEDFLEGCLSFPQLFGTVKRYLTIKLVWQEIIDGKLVKKKQKFEGFEAVVLQHEIDHLDGVLFIDHVKEDNGKFYKMIEGKLVKEDINKVLKETNSMRIN